MDINKNTLRDLAQLAETDRTILSAYLNTTRGWERVNDFIDREIKRIKPVLSIQELNHLDTSISFLYDYMNTLKQQQYRGSGIAFFIDIGADFTQGLELPVTPIPLIAVDNETIIHPLALQLDEYEPIGVIMLDAAAARVLIVAGNIVDDIKNYRKKIHHLSKVGGWSQMRYQRRRAKQIKHFSKEIIERAQQTFVQAGVKHILLSGRDRMITALEKELPQEWQGKIIAKVRWDLDAPDDQFIKKIRPLLEQQERETEENLLGSLIAEIRRHGLGVYGIEPTRKALNMGQVDILFISQSLNPEITESLTSLASASAASVEFIPADNQRLRELGGVGALLRFNI